MGLGLVDLSHDREGKEKSIRLNVWILKRPLPVETVNPGLPISQEHPNKRRCEVVGMFMEYVARTLEDNFHANDAFSPLRHSIAMATLSCDQQFHHVR